MPSINPVVYNNASLLSWKSELPLVGQQISENSQTIGDQTVYLRPLQEQLHSVELLISSARNQLITANMSATQDMMYHTYPHYHGHHHHHHHGDGVLHFMGDVMRTATMASLQSELERLQIQRVKLLSQMEPHERIINKAQAALDQLRIRQKWLNKHIPASESFLLTLHENPLKSVSDLTNNLVKAFTDYEDNHLTGLSPQVRISLIAVRYGLNELLAYQGGYAPEYMNQIQRSNYLCLCGFLWDMYNRVKQENKDIQFEKLLGGLVESTHVLQSSDLPEHLQTGYNAGAWFEGNKQKFPGYFAIQEQNLPDIEEQILNDGIAFHVQQSSVQPTSLDTHVANAINLIDAEVKMKKQKKEEIDYHFYGRAVRMLNDVIVNPADKQTAKRLGDIAEYASGSTAVGKQVLGGFLIVLGLVLIGASVAGFVTTFGSSSLLSASGVSLGLSLLQAEIVFGGASSIAAATGLGLTFFAGPNAIKSGRRQGLSQELMDVKEGVERYDVPPPYAAVY